MPVLRWQADESRRKFTFGCFWPTGILVSAAFSPKRERALRKTIGRGHKPHAQSPQAGTPESVRYASSEI